MKKLLFFLIIISFVLSSCQKDDIVKYSCNQEIDKWAKSNVTEIRQMSRAEFLDVDNEYQRAAYRVFTPEQRKTVWVSKLEDVLLLEWNDSEKNHIQSLISILERYSVIFCDNYTEEEKDEFDIAIYQWLEYAKEELGWNNKIIAAIVTNPNKLNNEKGVVSMTKVINRVKTEGEQKECNCHIDNGMIFMDCDSISLCVTAINCKESSLGCGLFWGDPCVGRCHGS